MIRGIHGLLYTPEPEELRELLRDKLRLPAHDVVDGWLMFDASGSSVPLSPIGPSP